MTRLLLAAAMLLVATVAVQAGPITKESPHSVAVTLDKLAAAVEGAGATVFARVDHAKGASSIGEDLRPTELLIFGNPKIGTPVMQANQGAGLDLPLRVVAFEGEDGKVQLQWHDPADLATAYGVPADHPALAAMSGALQKLTDAAVAN